ncbi:MAG TPA: ankyrin repeat domain-containing protein [Candidatus Binatia bacterium]|nr:ankyrin repeat domain-containing protein [Candidatus Binatia bacterium]
MSDIFISYTREEQPVARKLADALEGEGWSVWWDPKLRAGEHFDDVIEKALNEAKCVIVMWSERSVQSRYVRDEATYALENDKLLPVAIENVTLPFRFRGVQTRSLLNWDGSRNSSGFRRLVEDISTILGPSPMRRAEGEEPSKLDEVSLRKQARPFEEEAKRKDEQKHRRIISRIRNKPLSASAILLALLLIGLASFTDAVNKLLNLLPTKRPETARIELSRLSLEYTGDVFVDAAANNDLHAVKLFLAAGMDPNVKTKTDSTALREAIRAGHTAVVKELVQHGADFDGYELSRPAIQDNVELLRVMLEAGAKTDAKNEAFLFAASSGRFENMRALFDDGVELGNIGEEALRRAAGSRFNGDQASDDTQNDIVRFLLDLGVDPKVPDDKGMSALHYAARNGFLAVTRTLLDQGIRVNGKSKRGWTPLFEALYRYNSYPPDNKSEPIIDLLLVSGADVNVRDSEGKTPLMLAAQWRSAKVVKRLIDAGARVTDQDNSGRSALSFGKYNHRNEQEEIMRLLRAPESEASIAKDTNGK